MVRSDVAARATVIAAIAFSLVVCGCGKSETAVDASANGNPEASAGSSDPAADGPRAQPSPKRGRDEVYTDATGQKWFGNVPYDVFPENPYAMASNQTPIGGVPGETDPPVIVNNGGEAPVNNSDVRPDPSMTNDTPVPSPGTDSADGDQTMKWEDLITAQTLDNEVKEARNFLLQNLTSVGAYNSAMLSIPRKVATIAVLANVAMESEAEDVTWREDAAIIRDLAKKMNADILQRGAKDQKRLLALFEPLSETLNRSKPAGLEEPNMEDTYCDVAEMSLVMYRMQDAQKQIMNEAGSENSFTANKDMVLHEAAVLATLTHVVVMPGYGYEDDPEFVGYSNEVVQAAREIMSAAEAGNFSGYEQAMSKISVTCDKCHRQFKSE